MSRKPRAAPNQAAPTIAAPHHTELESFAPFKGYEIGTIDQLAEFMETFGVYRIYIRSPASRTAFNDHREAEEGKWEVGLRLNKFFYDYVRSGPCDTLHEALEKALGIKVPTATSVPVEDIGDLLV